MSDFENWTRELSEFWDNTARKTEAFAERTLHDAVAAADHLTAEIEKQLAPTLEQWADELSQSLAPLEAVLDEEVERFSEEFTELMTPLVVPLAEALEAWVEAMAAPINSHVEPMINEHSPCIGCKHYYGQAHGGHMLVCAMYPYGPEEEHCPDWESVWSQPPNPPNNE